MRTDVKVGLICIFAIVLLVVIYFVAQGNRNPQKASASPTTPTVTAPSASPKNESVQSLQVSPPSTPAATPAAASPASTDLTSHSLASAGGATTPLIAPPSSGDRVIGPPPTVSPASASTATPGMTGSASPALSGGVPTTGPSAAPGSGLIPAPSTPSAPSSFSNNAGGSNPGRSTVTFGNTPGAVTPPGRISGLRNPRSNAGAPPVATGNENSTFSFGNNVGNSTGTTYKIQKGDMLGSLAKKFNVSLKALEAANPGVDSSHLKIDQEIKIPAGGTGISTASATPTTPAGGTTATRPSRTHTGTVAGPTAADTGASHAIKPGSSYTVKKGDTLSTIAQAAYGTKAAWQRIFRANRGELANANDVAVGTILQIPN